MTKVTITNVSRGSAPGDGTGDTAYLGTGKINNADNALAAAINDLASEGWNISNSTESVSFGEKVLVTAASGTITKTLPGAAAIRSDDYNTIWILNGDASDNVSIATTGGDLLYLATASVGTSYSLPAGYVAILVTRNTSSWQLIAINTKETAIPSIPSVLSDLNDVATAGLSDGDILEYNSSSGDWEDIDKESADIVIRSRPNLEVTPAVEHTTKGTKTSNFSITVHTEPSADVTLGSDSVVINFDTTTSAVSAATRGLTGMKLCGKVFVHDDGSDRAPGTPTTDADSSVIKNTPTSLGTSKTWALVWEYYHNGTTDFIWIEWVDEDV